MVENFQLVHFFVNGESLIDVKVSKVMCYIMCYNKLICHVVSKQITRLRKGFVSYFKNSGKLYLKTM
jgi:hypothetical protein